MTGTVTYGDGLRIELATDETVVADANAPDGDVAIVSHAHGDHLYRSPPAEAVWSPLTRALAAVRRPDVPLPDRVDHPRIELFDAGHVPGSRAALIEGERTYLYTGDASTRDRLYLDGFEPPLADVLIVESTYGEPGYEFPPTAEVADAFLDWLAESADQPAICFGYSLGRAQEVQHLLAQSERERVLVSPAIAEINAVIEDHLDVSFPVEVYDGDADLDAGDALVLPGRRRGSYVDDLIDEANAVTAGLSGWALHDGYRFARDVDAGFPLSDHCDFEELCDLVRGVDPEEVFVLHGSTGAFADHVTTELGYPATALKRNQSRLSQF